MAGLVDTAAARSLMSGDLAKRLGSRMNHEVRVKEKVCGVIGDRLTTIGAVTECFKLGSIRGSHEFMVVNRMTQSDTRSRLAGGVSSLVDLD